MRYIQLLMNWQLRVKVCKDNEYIEVETIIDKELKMLNHYGENKLPKDSSWKVFVPEVNFYNDIFRAIIVFDSSYFSGFVPLDKIDYYPDTDPVLLMIDRTIDQADGRIISDFYYPEICPYDKIEKIIKIGLYQYHPVFY